MNVIIRLQNLPWSAQATDIRNFFKGLNIPEGGVHIVGGENGDAFIAFSSDEDARQAMQLNGGKIKETQVSLLLSSRAEMQKVIEKARQASTNAFAITKMSTQAPSAASIANQFAKKLPEAAVVATPQPPVITLSSFLTQSMQQQAPPQVSATQPQQLNLMSAYQTLASNDMSGLSGLTSLPQVGLPTPNAAAAAAYYAALMGGPNPVAAYANPIAAGLSVKQPIENVKPTSYLSDPRSRRSNSRERNRYRSRSPERRSSRRSRSNSRDRYPNDSDGKEGSRRRTRFSAAQDRVEVPKHSAMAAVVTSSSSSSFSVPPPSNNIWEHPPPQVFAHEINAQQNNLNAYYNQNNASAIAAPRNNYKTENSSSAASGSFGNIGTCVKVSNVDSETFYSDLRKFFAGLPIGQNDIKFITDGKGNRTGSVLIRFLSSDSKKKALTKSMWQLKSTQVMITSVSEEDFESGMMKPANRGNQGNNRNDDRFDSRNDRFRDRSDSRDRDYPKRGRFEGGRGDNNRFDDRPQNNRDGGNFRQRDQSDRNQPRNFRNDEQDKAKEYQPDENFSVLIIDDIPRTANESDICEAFPNIVSIVIERYKAYVKFTSHENAKVTLENRFIHYIRNKRVFLEAGSEAQFNDLARKNGKFDNPENKDSAESGNGSAGTFANEMNDDSNSRDSSRNQKSFESRDPRQRNFANEQRNDFPSNGNGGAAPNQIKTDCIIMKNMEPDTTIEEVENFFKDLGIYKMRVHILLDKRGQPCGDCFVEFKYPNDSYRAVVKNEQLLRTKHVTVMLIPREQVQAVLSSFGNDDRPQPAQQQQQPQMNNMQNRNRRNDWAPPSDFGSPGCVVMLSNLCYRATTEDILDCFREFELHPDQVIRRFNDMGQPTGNACVNFNSQEDAEMALDKYNSAKIMDRPVWLKRA